MRIWPLLALLVVAACSAPPASDVKFDSFHSVALDGSINAGEILTMQTNEAIIRAEITDQVYYVVGQLNGYNGVADIAHLEVKLLQSEPVTGTNLTLVRYSAKVMVAWDRSLQIPGQFSLILPARGDWSGIDTFITKYGDACHEESHDPIDQSVFWYYYRPYLSGCQLPAADDPLVVRRLAMSFAVSSENTTGKYPEYAKVWEDKKLTVTALFGKEKSGATSLADSGITAYNTLYNSLRSRYGVPASQSVALGNTLPGPFTRNVQMTWDLGQGRQLDVQIMLVEAVLEMTSDEMQLYNDRTKISDFVSYSGHSGLGANIRGLARMGSFQPGQYQLFMVNGCDTFAYVDNALRDAHQTVNPGTAPDKYFDLITNAMPSYFSSFAMSDMIVINSLIGSSWTFRQMLSQFDPVQKAVVTGEQDNAYPNPF